jgi:hypothetical protein
MQSVHGRQCDARWYGRRARSSSLVPIAWRLLDRHRHYDALFSHARLPGIFRVCGACFTLPHSLVLRVARKGLGLFRRRVAQRARHDHIALHGPNHRHRHLGVRDVSAMGRVSRLRRSRDCSASARGRSCEPGKLSEARELAVAAKHLRCATSGTNRRRGQRTSSNRVGAVPAAAKRAAGGHHSAERICLGSFSTRASIARPNKNEGKRCSPS